jgi:chitin deacetylase
VADRHLFVGQHSLSLAVVAAALSFISGCSLPAARSASPRNFLTEITPNVNQQADSNTSQEKALVAQPNQAYKKAISKLIQQENIQRLNKPIPAEFQGKTFKDIKVNSAIKAVAKGTPDKPSGQDAMLKPIALTFDDGPWPNSTAQALDVLKKNNVKATFFVVGRQVQKYPQLAQRIVAEGHAIANHSWSHQYHRYSEAGAASEIDKTADIVYKITGVKTNLFRPPGGILNNGLAAYAQQKKYGVVMWSADSLDWRYHNANVLLSRVLKEASTGGIVLMHDGGGDRSKTLRALPQLMGELKKRGYKFVTVPELMEMQQKDKELMARKG